MPALARQAISDRKGSPVRWAARSFDRAASDTPLAAHSLLLRFRQLQQNPAALSAAFYLGQLAVPAVDQRLLVLQAA